METKICNHIRELIGKDRIEEAIELLKANTTNRDSLNAIIIQSANYDEVKKFIQAGTISFEQSNISKAKIRYALLKLVDELEVSKIEKSHVSENNIRLIVIFIFLLIAMVLYTLSIRQQTLKSKENIDTTTPQMNPPKRKEDKEAVFTPQISEPIVKPQKQKPANEPLPVKKTETIIKETSVDIHDEIEEKKLPMIKGQILDKFNKGIRNVTIFTQDGIETRSNDFGLFKLKLQKTADNYPFKIYLYYSKDSLQNKDLVRVGQKNVILRFN